MSSNPPYALIKKISQIQTRSADNVDKKFNCEFFLICMGTWLFSGVLAILPCCFTYFRQDPNPSILGLLIYPQVCFVYIALCSISFVEAIKEHHNINNSFLFYTIFSLFLICIVCCFLYILLEETDSQLKKESLHWMVYSISIATILLGIIVNASSSFQKIKL